jgi:hypothetical protein
MILSSNLQAVLFIAGMALIVGSSLFMVAIHLGLIMADPDESPTTNEGND